MYTDLQSILTSRIIDKKKEWRISDNYKLIIECKMMGLQERQ